MPTRGKKEPQKWTIRIKTKKERAPEQKAMKVPREDRTDSSTPMKLMKIRYAKCAT